MAVPDATSVLPAWVPPLKLPSIVRLPLAATVISGATVPLPWYRPKTRFGVSPPVRTSAGLPSWASGAVRRVSAPDAAETLSARTPTNRVATPRASVTTPLKWPSVHWT
ncbi:hypothetical protein SVIO_002490 [Streptomyces violaceusniger]|uniref:Uncharacterized protein n=1 Tax=Streptomyces violaceusniger TaxID=68280 RepID=A0A4D4KRV6_STRVO|nr:hypothetical protein SVIO_002490 [Streptomyces violaceusniger]